MRHVLWTNPLPVKLSYLNLLNPLIPHDALKHHFTSMKKDLMFLQLGVL